MKKILALLGFLIAGLTAFRSLESMSLSQEEQQEIGVAVQGVLQAAQDMTEDAIQAEISRLGRQLTRVIKASGKGSIQAQTILAQKRALTDLRERKYVERQIEISKFNVNANLNTEQFNSFKCSHLDKSLQPYKELSALGVFASQNADDLISAVIRKFLQENKETLNLQLLQSLLENIKLLKPAEEKKEAPKSKAKQQEEERKEDSRPHSEAEKKEDGDAKGKTSKGSEQSDLLPVLMSTQVAAWKRGALQEDPEAAKLLDNIILDLKNERNNGTMIRAQYTQRFFDIHIGKRQRLYFAYETINSKRTLLLLFGGPKTDQTADITSAHAWHMRFLAEEKKSQKGTEKSKKK